MTINKKAQLKISDQDYTVFRTKQLVQQLTPESKERLMEYIQAKIVLEGAQVKNHEVLNILKGV